ncbi:MAG: DUF1116 domain-containing protein [Verrucomicrobia bacterium]|nr:DUF1116 domain-containing protein [Verrucomicrobiota bacterium]
MNIDKANETVVARMKEARPVLKRVVTAREAVPGMRDNLLLHAGPPIEWERMSGPMRGAVIGGLIFEGLAKDEKQAVGMVEAGEVDFEPCHEHGAVGPMAGVTAPSMKVYEIENITHGNKAYSSLNEGYGKVLRYGAFSEEVIAKLRWMNDVLGPIINDALSISDGGMDIRQLLSESLHMGDEGHNRNKAGSILYTAKLAPLIAKVVDDKNVESDVLKFLGDNALSVLNPVMAACKATADAGHGVEGSSIMSVMARNGTEVGIRVSGLGDQWFTGPVGTPAGLYFDGFSAADASGDIGDSTITETAGIGAFAMAAAPAIVTFISGTPQMAMEATQEMYQITVGEHEAYTIPVLNFRGTPCGVDIRKVVELGITPRINTGIAHKEAGVGQVGAGLVRPPMSMFEDALDAFNAKYGGR